MSCTRESVTAAAVRDPLSCRQTDMYPDYRTGHGSVPGAVRETLRMGKITPGRGLLGFVPGRWGI